MQPFIEATALAERTAHPAHRVTFPEGKLCALGAPIVPKCLPEIFP